MSFLSSHYELARCRIPVHGSAYQSARLRVGVKSSCDSERISHISFEEYSIADFLMALHLITVPT